jgi:hypothetical protein
MIVTMGPAWSGQTSATGSGSAAYTSYDSAAGDHFNNKENANSFGGYDHLVFTAVDAGTEAGEHPTGADDLRVKGLQPGDKIWNQCDIHVMKTGGCMPDEITFDMFKHGVCDALVNKKQDMLEKMKQMYMSTAYPEGSYTDPAQMEMEVTDKLGRMQELVDGGMYDADMCHGHIDTMDFGYDMHDVFCSMADAECKCMRVPMHDTLDFVAQCDAAPSQLSMYYDSEGAGDGGADGVGQRPGARGVVGHFIYSAEMRRLASRGGCLTVETRRQRRAAAASKAQAAKAVRRGATKRAGVPHER